MKDANAETEKNSGTRQEAPLSLIASDRVGRWLCFGGAMLLILVGGVSLTLSCCRPGPTGGGGIGRLARPSFDSGRNVRVRLIEGMKQITVRTFASFHWTGPDGGWRQPGSSGEHIVSASGSGLVIDGRIIPRSSVTLDLSEEIFELNDRLYRGSLTVSTGSNGRLVATETLSLEDYVRGVVPSEMPPRWPQHALMAQAVAVRSFALHRSLNTPGRNWISQLDLAYKGVEGESKRTDEAVLATEGTTLRWAGKPLPAFFHSTCGGHTTTAFSVFGGLDIPPLQGGPCRWCADSPHYRWDCQVALSRLADKVSSRGIRNIGSLHTRGRDASGRVENVIINGSKNIPAGEFRLEVGAGSIKSTAFSAAVEDNKVIFSGRGWGHGVGLCQWGARGMAEEGKTWREILQHYYPGGTIAPRQELIP